MHYFNLAGASHTFEHLKPANSSLSSQWVRHQVYQTQETLPISHFPHLESNSGKERYVIFFNHPLAVKSYFANLQQLLTSLDSPTRDRYLKAQLNHVYIFPGNRGRLEFDHGFTALASHFNSRLFNDIEQVYRFTPAGQEQMGVRQGLRSFWLEMLKTQYSENPSLAVNTTNPCKALLDLVQANPNYTWQGIAYTNSASQFDYAGVWNELAENLEDLLDDLDWEAYEKTPTYFEIDVLKHLVAHPPRIELTTVPCYTNELDISLVHQLGKNLLQQVATTQDAFQAELPATFTQLQSSPATPTQLSYLKTAGLNQHGSRRHLLLGEFRILKELCTQGDEDTPLQSKYDKLLELEQDYIFLISSSSTLKRLQEFFEFADYVQTVVTDKSNTHKVQVVRANGRVEYMDYATPSYHQVNYATMKQPVAPSSQGFLQLSEPSKPETAPTQIFSNKYGTLTLKTSSMDTLQNLDQSLDPNGLPTQTLAHIYEFTPSSQVTLPQGKRLPVFISLNLDDSVQMKMLIDKLHELRMLHIREL